MPAADPCTGSDFGHARRARWCLGWCLACHESVVMSDVGGRHGTDPVIQGCEAAMTGRHSSNPWKEPSMAFSPPIRPVESHRIVPRQTVSTVCRRPWGDRPDGHRLPRCRSRTLRWNASRVESKREIGVGSESGGLTKRPGVARARGFRRCGGCPSVTRRDGLATRANSRLANDGVRREARR